MKHTLAAVWIVVFGCAIVATAQVTGSGTTNYIARWASSTKLGNSRLFQANSNNCSLSTVCGVGIGTTTPSAHLHVVINQSGVGAIAKVENKGLFSAALLELKAASFDTLNDWTITAQDNSDGSTRGLIVNGRAGLAWATAPNLNFGIGTYTPTTKLQVVGGDIDTANAGAGLIVKSPDGTKCARIGLDNFGNIVATPVTCP